MGGGGASPNLKHKSWARGEDAQSGTFRQKVSTMSAIVYLRYRCNPVSYRMADMVLNFVTGNALYGFKKMCIRYKR